ncbi:kanadaptin [Linepithema humile]|uniref:kanadaptin n=1 Tax=Linepithema humile TaxID=83485 RepID=UPI00351E312D
MEANEQKSDFTTSLSKDASMTDDNMDTSNEIISELAVCDKQSTESTENKSESFQNEADTCKDSGFKKPLLLIGPKRGKIGKIRTMNNNIASSSTPSSSTPLSVKNEATASTHSPTDTKDKINKSISTEGSIEENVLLDMKNIPVPYVEPTWSGKPTEDYKFEILKSGIILGKIDLSEKSFHVVGRLPSCDMSLAHPTISRYHAIIQYRTMEDDNNLKGFYLYDLESTHGTFWNGHRIKPRTYVRLHGGHMIRFGCSKRKYILLAPPDDEEPLQIPQFKLLRTQSKETRLEELQEQEEAEGGTKETQESEGIDWGMREDADEETDLTENPYASTADEELYLDDPKKTLRGWFEREGYDLQYQVEEKGIGQFLCWVILPKECFGGHSMKAEALVKGKKKESVIQCALEACRILDRHGLLRQANHESRKKKTKNWEEADYYDSDEDNFLDRTGTVERKREQRMKQAGKLEKKTETYNSLSEKHSEIVNKISHLTNRLKEAQESSSKAGESNEDSLDAFMSNLNQSSLSKSDVTKMKVELQNLRKEEMRLVKLVNLTKPANLPPLISTCQIQDKKDDSQEKSKSSTRKISQLEKRRKLFEAKNNDSERVLNSNDMDNEEEEEEEDEDKDKDKDKEDNTEDNTEKDDTREIECDKSISYEDKVESEEKAETNDKQYSLKSINQDTEISKQDVNVADDKKRKKERKNEKSKNIKKHYDQDVHTEDYSTWLPPQGQSGDGRTSLNDKYGY